MDSDHKDRAKVMASSVGRIVHKKLGWLGTGFKISNNLLLTCNHVIPDQRQANDITVEFNYEVDQKRTLKPVSKFNLDPNKLFISSPKKDLDFTMIAIGKKISGYHPLCYFGYCQIDRVRSRTESKWANIIHHPKGKTKQISFQENPIIAHDNFFLYYHAATEMGSSGAPIFNDKWDLIAVHHWAMPTRETFLSNGLAIQDEAREGVRITSILEKLKSDFHLINKEQAILLKDALNC